MNIIILDTTLRDGEQTAGISYTDDEKLSIAKILLQDLKVDRLEVASARVSEGEFNAVRKITDWAIREGFIDKIEVLGFVDGVNSINWLKDSGCKVLNLLTKGSLNHCKYQLKKEPKEHFADIKKTIENAKKENIRVNIYLEDWSNGMKNSYDYVIDMLDELKGLDIGRFMLPDTLGILNPAETTKYIKDVVNRYPDLKFDFHAHNDYDLASANVFAAINAGVDCIHGTVNGLGERAGNMPLSSLIAIVNDHTDFELNADESKLNFVSRMVEMYSGIRIPQNKPLIGENVFTQTAGIHADGDSKRNLYFNNLLPERFGRTREYALGKTSGKANIKKNLEVMGIELDDDSMKKVTQHIISLGDKKEIVTREDLPYIISDVLRSKTIESNIEVLNYNFSIGMGLKPIASVKIEIKDKGIFEEYSVGDGQYDAFAQAVKKIYDKQNKKLPKLINYVVSIPPGGRTDALVQANITWQIGDKEFHTRGLDSDQTIAAIKATIKMLNVIEDFGE
jgi:D-citramalate synthase